MKKNNSSFKQFIVTHRLWLAFGAIVLIAIVFRFYQLASLPPGLHPDEAANGLDIFRILEKGDIRVIYNTNGPREALFFYIQALFVAILGNSIAALRVAPAMFGVLAVVMVFLYTKDWFNNRTALIAAFLIAVNPWVVTISRDGFRASMVPFMIAAVAFFAGRAYTKNKTIYFVLSAVFFALGFYTYTAFIMFGLVVLLGLGYVFLRNKKWLIANLKNLLIATAVFVVLIAPLVVTTLRNPSASTARVGGTSVLSEQYNDGKPIAALIESTGKTLLQFHYYGDDNSRHNLPSVPYLNTFVGIMLILGLLVAASRYKHLKYLVLLAMFFIMMLPAILTAEGLPHGLRSIGTAASVFTLSAIGINYLLVRWHKTFPLNGPARTVGSATITVLLGLTLIIGWQQYFVAWAQDPRTFESYNENMVQIAKFLNTQDAQSKFLVAGDYEAFPVEYLTHKKSTYQLVSSKKLSQLPLSNRSLLFVFPSGSNSNAIIEILKAKYPTGILQSHNSNYSGEVLYYSFKVSPQ